MKTTLKCLQKLEVRQSMLALKEYDPQWYLDKDDIEKHNPSLCLSLIHI